MRLALLDDDSRQITLITDALASAGHTCHPYDADEDALNQLQQDGADMLIIDHRVGGAEELQWARRNLTDALPALFLAGRGDEDEIFTALQGGANDYLIKPIRRGELLIRVQTLLRRSYPDRIEPDQIRFGHYVFEPQSGRLSIAGRQISLTQKEFSLALLFFRHLGRPLSRAYILDAIWSRETDIPSRTMDTHVSRVRNKLHLRPENGFRLLPVYSYGYRLELLRDAPVTTVAYG